MKLIQKLSKLALIASVAVLGTACGSDDEATDEATAFRQSIVGTWTTACRDESSGGDSESSISTFVITMDSVTNSGVEYSGDATCVTETGTWGPSVVTFTIGDEFTTGSGTTAYELNIDIEGEADTTHSALQLVADQLLVADEDDNNSTVETRDITFDSPGTYTKQ